MRRKSNTVWLVVVAVVAVLGIGSCNGYNGLVQRQEAATTQWANLEATYQRRADLIPNLSKTVKAYAKHESSTLEEVARARASVGQMHIDPSQLTPERLRQFQQSQGELSSAIGRLMVVAEKYPDLKANENFKDLQIQLEGSENRINEARQRYNEAVQAYNQGARTFPTVIVARLFGFQPMTKFEAQSGAERAPEVDLD